jgi:2-dehydro-3-deoxyphosphogalactonate aldolase
MSNNLELPLVAILRGLTPDTCIEVCRAIIEQGFTIIEVPLNSPDALVSIQILVNEFGENYLIGAGTVTTTKQAMDVIATGAKLIVSPNCNIDVIKLGVSNGCTVLPGVLTPTEAFTALDAGASGLKVFPANVMGVSGFSALMSVLPKGTKCYPVGGIEASSQSMAPYIAKGAAGFGIGAALYKPSLNLDQVVANAKQFVKSYHKSITEHC